MAPDPPAIPSTGSGTSEQSRRGLRLSGKASAISSSESGTTGRGGTPRRWRPGLLGGLRSRWPLLLALSSAFAFVPSSEAGLGVGVASLLLAFLFSSRREGDAGLLLCVLGVGVLVSARSFYPGLGTLLGGLYLLGRSRWGPDAPVPRLRIGAPAPSLRGMGREPASRLRRSSKPSTPWRRDGGSTPRGRGGSSGLWANHTLYELVTALGAVALVVALLQQGTATWPAMVAVESCSMEPNIQVGDLVLVLGTRRTPVATQAGDRVRIFPPGPDGAPPRVEVDLGEGADLRSFSSAPGCVAELIDSQGFSQGCRERREPLSGDVIVFYPNGNSACTPIIHRARAWIPDNTTLAGRTFPRGGFITKGDNNGPVRGSDPLQAADQVAGGGRDACPNSQPVRPEWLVGTARFRIPWLGYVRLLFGNSPKSCATGL